MGNYIWREKSSESCTYTLNRGMEKNLKWDKNKIKSLKKPNHMYFAGDEGPQEKYKKLVNFYKPIL